jgi:hypothetical protein
MKTAIKFSVTITLALGLIYNSFSQMVHEKPINLKFKNNRLIFSKVNLLAYRPNENGRNEFNSFVMMPFSTKTTAYPVGTKIYFANSKQIDVVMGGKSVNDKPFMIVSKEDEGKTFKIY